LDTQGQCNLIDRTKNVYCKSYKNTYTMYNIKPYNIYKYDIFIILSFFNVYKNYETQIIKIQRICKYTWNAKCTM